MTPDPIAVVTQHWGDEAPIWIMDLARECASRRIDFTQCATNEPFEERFLDLLVRGSVLAGGH